MIFFASAVSCTPASSTMIWFGPCCWISGSDTPRAFTRWRSVVTFWLIVLWASSRSLSGFTVAFSTKRLPVLGPSLTTRSG